MKKFLLVILMAGFGSLYGQGRIFTYTYQSATAEKGEKEISVWTTLLSGRENYYLGISHRLEFEMGLNDRLQTAVELNYGYSKFIETNNGIQVLNTANSYSVMSEWRYRLSDLQKQKFGSALYFEYTLGTSYSELEGKIIVDKKTGRFIQALNLSCEYEYFKIFTPNGPQIDITHGQETKIELNYGFGYQIKDGFYLGFEAMNQNFIYQSEWESSVLTLGPAFSYNAGEFKFNFTLMPQITNLKTGKRELTENNKIMARLILSFEL